MNLLLKTYYHFFYTPIYTHYTILKAANTKLSLLLSICTLFTILKAANTRLSLRLSICTHSTILKAVNIRLSLLLSICTHFTILKAANTRLSLRLSICTHSTILKAVKPRLHRCNTLSEPIVIFNIIGPTSKQAFNYTHFYNNNPVPPPPRPPHHYLNISTLFIKKFPTHTHIHSLDVWKYNVTCLSHNVFWNLKKSLHKLTTL